MKILICLIGFVILVVGAGCRSTNDRVTYHSTTSQRTTQTTELPDTGLAPDPQIGSAGSTAQHGTVGDFDYTIEVIPNPRLSATSREGDKLTEVYSSNIVAVYVSPHKGVTVGSTNSPAVPNQENNPEPAGK